MGLFARLSHGLKNHKLVFLTTFLSCYGLIWLLVESLGAFSKESFGFLQQPIYLVIALIISAIFALAQSVSKLRLVFSLHHSNTTVEVKFADFFEERGLRVIAVNEYFDSELGNHVSPHSLHGQLVSRHFGGSGPAFRAVIDEKLANCNGSPKSRSSGNQVCFPIGTAIVIPTSSERYLLFALCRTEEASLKAHTNLPDYMDAIGRMWDTARSSSNGEPVVVPVIGTGLAGLGLPSPQMLDLLLLSFVEANKRKEVCQRLVVVLDKRKFEEFDLTKLKATWV